MFSTERIGFDLSKLSACDPIATPLTAFDQRRSWSGQVLGDDPIIHVTAAAFNGKPVYFEVFAGDSMESTSTSKETPEIFIFFSIVSLTLILGAIALTWRNLKSGRCDRPGANKVAGYVVFVSLISWLFAGHHIPAPAEFRVFGLAFNWAVGFGVMVWVFYVALEPFIRRRWPQLLISWTRLLRGQWSDVVGCVTIALVSTIIGHDAQLSWAGWASVLLVVALNMVILLRFGFLAAFGASATAILLEGPLTTNPSVFYFSHTVLGMIAVGAFAAYGAYFSVEKTIRARYPSSF
jgi:hypothetical protein